MTWQPLVPWSMLLLRVLLGPVLLLAATRRYPGPTLGAIVLLALLSDICDGILARRWHCDTPTLRLADSLADTIFYLAVAAALWIRNPAVLRASWPLLATLLLLEAARHAFDLCKFRKSASYHSYLAKSWGLVMATAVTAVLGLDALYPALAIAVIRISILLGILTNLEGLAMSLILPRWHNDIKTLARAWTLRKQILAARS